MKDESFESWCHEFLANLRAAQRDEPRAISVVIFSHLGGNCLIESGFDGLSGCGYIVSALAMLLIGAPPYDHRLLRP